LEIGLLLQKLEKDKSNLIKALQIVQQSESFISDNSIREISNYFSIPVVDVEGIISFYTQFKRAKPGKYIISACDGTACHIKGSSLVINWISDELNIKDGETDSEGLFSLQTVACLGCCSLAPVMSINGRVFGKLNRRELIKILRRYRRGMYD
jgi:NADH:ubiquinone oxidoreductase subunit E